MKASNSDASSVTRRDITILALRTALLQAGFNYERMQSVGFTAAMLPLLKKLYGEDKKGLSQAMKDNLQFINTHPALVGFLMSLLIALEEKRESRELIKGLRLALFAPIAGIGDAVFWFTLLPVIVGVTASFAISGNLLGPILFFLVYLGIFLLRIPLSHLGYRLGVRAIEQIKGASQNIAHAATILGVTVIGALVASYVKISVLSTIAVNAEKQVSIQADFFDKILPNLLSALYVGFIFYMLKNRQTSPVTLIVITFVLALFFSFLGIL